MEWQDEGVVIAARPHGETSVIVELLTRQHGRHAGLVHGGRSSRMRPVLQAGNHVAATWKARTADQLGMFTLETIRPFSVEAFSDPLALAGLAALTDLTRQLPERDPHPNLFEITQFVLGYLGDRDVWPALYVRWEIALLDELGAGLDLSKCVATGATDNLIYVSPKSGCAVCEQAGAPYADKLLRLPPFLRKGDNRRTELTDIRDGLELSGHFLRSRVLAPGGRELPEPRARFIARLEKLIAEA